MKTVGGLPGVRRRLALFAVIAALAVSYSGAKYARLLDYVGSTTYHVRVDLLVAGGIFPGAEVTYRGVPIGRVTKVVPADGNIAADLAIDNQWRVPADARAEVHDRSAVGEQYIDLVPPNGRGPFLHDGSTIALADTSTPLPPEQLLATLDRFARSVDTGALSTTVNELGKAFSGTSEDLGRILDASSGIVGAAKANLPVTISLLQHAAVVMRTQNAQASDLRSFTHSLAELTSTVATHDQDLHTIFVSGTQLTNQLEALVASLLPNFAPLFGNLAVLTAIGDRNVAGLEEALVALPYNIAGLPAGARGGAAQFVLQTTSSPAVCEKGYIPAGQRRSTQDLTPAAPDYNARCADPALVPRGSAHAP